MATVGSTRSVHVEQLEQGSFWRVVFNGPKASVLDIATIKELTEVFVRAKEVQTLKVACFEGARANFSFGASVEEHLPDRVEDMLTSSDFATGQLADDFALSQLSVDNRSSVAGLISAAENYGDKYADIFYFVGR